MKKLRLLILLLLGLCMLTSCSATNNFLAMLGFDTYDYAAEEVTETYAADSEKAVEISEMVKTLTINSIEIPEFSDSKDAVEKCRDSLLNYMLYTRYTKYTGNLTLLDRASEEYPYLKMSTIIPSEDFEDEAYRYFGGKQKVSNSNGKVFTYLDKVEAYTTVTSPSENKIEVETVSLEETEKTYRFKFKCILEEETSDEYFALLLKRNDGTCYFKYVEKVAQ